MRGRAAVAVVLCAVATAAHAGGLDLDALNPRAIGRAGAGVVSADDGTALWLNPAGLARRGGWRAQLELSLSSRSTSFVSSSFGDQAAEVRDRAAVRELPAIAVEGGLGDRVMVGLATLTPGDLAYDSPTPPAGGPGACGADDRFVYPHRYAGTQLRYTRRGVAAGASVRALPWLAIGASALAFDVRVSEARSIWGGQGTDLSEPMNLCPAFDMPFTASAHDAFVPGASLGVLIAPPDAPIEIAVSALWSDDARLSGQPTLDPSRGTMGGAGTPFFDTATVAADAAVHATLAMPFTARAGVRFLARRFSIEMAADLAHGTQTLGGWSVTGVDMTNNNLPTQTTALTAMPATATLRDSFALRAAADVDLVPGFLTLTAGYALGDLTRHTVALGAEARVDRTNITFGVSHTFDAAPVVDDPHATIVHPFATGTLPAAAGRVSASATMVGLAVEMEL